MEQQRTYLGWGLLPVGVVIVLLLNALGALPSGLVDLIGRASPILLVLIGLILLLRGRMPFGGIVALVLSVAIAGGVATYAYSSRANQARTENQIAFEQIIDDSATLLVINIDITQTDLTLRSRTNNQRAVSGLYIGSEDSALATTLDTSAAPTIEYTLVEEKSEQFPRLIAVGRGNITVDVPSNMAVALNIIVDDGLTTLSLGDLQLERLTLTIQRGDAAVNLPNYQPISLNPSERPSEISLQNGDLTLLVPNEIDVRVAFDRRGSGVAVQYDSLYIDQRDTVDGILRREIETSDVRLYFDVLIPRGQLRLDVIQD